MIRMTNSTTKTILVEFEWGVGVKDPSLFLSALDCQKHTFDGIELYPTVLEKAAIFLRTLSMNHAFHNGNKRTAVLATIIFLNLNGYEIKISEAKLINFALYIVRTKPLLTVERIVKSLKKYTRYSYQDKHSSKNFGSAIRKALEKVFS